MRRSLRDVVNSFKVEKKSPLVNDELEIAKERSDDGSFSSCPLYNKNRFLEMEDVFDASRSESCNSRL